MPETRGADDRNEVLAMGKPIERPQAFAADWNECAVVRAYLEAVERNLLEPRGASTPPPTERSWCNRDSRRVRADAFAGTNLDRDLPGVIDTAVDLTALEERFVGVAYRYGASRGISYAAWRAVGVAPAVLGRAGITTSM